MTLFQQEALRLAEDAAERQRAQLDAAIIAAQQRADAEAEHAREARRIADAARVDAETLAAQKVCQGFVVVLQSPSVCRRRPSPFEKSPHTRAVCHMALHDMAHYRWVCWQDAILVHAEAEAIRRSTEAEHAIRAAVAQAEDAASIRARNDAVKTADAEVPHEALCFGPCLYDRRIYLCR